MASVSVPAASPVDEENVPVDQLISSPPILTDETTKTSANITADEVDLSNVSNMNSRNITSTMTTDFNNDDSYQGENCSLLQQGTLLTTDYTGCGVPVPATVDEGSVPVAPVALITPTLTVTHIGGDEVDSSLSNVTDTNSMVESATGVAVSGGNFDDVFGNTVTDDSGHTSNHGSFNTTNETYNSSNSYTRNGFSRSNISPPDTAHNFRAGTFNNFEGAKNVNTGTNYGAHSNVVVRACLISNLT